MLVKSKKFICVALSLVIATGVLAGCGNTSDNGVSYNETVTLRILENDTAKKQGYFDELLKAFNEAYADKNIVAVDADMDEYSDLATNGPYGYGPDIIYQANDVLMTYAEDKHIFPIEVEKLDCYSNTPGEAWDAFKIDVDGTTYCCGVPVNIQEPMLFYRADKLPQEWETEWDADGNKTPDFFENWNDLYAYSKMLRDDDTSAAKDSQYGFMTSFNNLYLNSEFLLSYGGYVFAQNEDGTFDTTDIGMSGGNSAKGLMALKQFAGLMNEGCIDDTITSNRYEKVADGTYFCAVSTPDTHSLFIEKLALQYEAEGMDTAVAKEKATENLKMIELPAKMPANGDLSVDTTDYVDTIVMGGVNGYGISAYTKYKDACMEFINFATSYDMLKKRADMLGIAPTRNDVAEATGGTTEMILTSLKESRIYLMPSVKAITQVWTPVHTLFGDVAKDPFRETKGECIKYTDEQAMKEALIGVDEQIYDSIYTMAE